MSVQFVNRILDSIQLAEAGYWNDPIGGPTNYGITQSTLDHLRIRHSDLLPEKVSELDSDMARVIIKTQFLLKTRVLELPYPLSMVHSHMVVMAWDDGIRIMQKRLGVRPDGIIGRKTLNAARSQSSIDMLYGVYQDLSLFIKSRTNGFQASYTRRFNAIEF